MDELTKARMVMAALDFCDPDSLAHIELAYYDGWHPVASDAKIRPNGLNKRLQEALRYPKRVRAPYGFPSQSEAYAAAAEALGLEPIPLVEPGMVQIPQETARRGLQALEVVRRLDALQDCRMVHWADGLDDLIAALSGIQSTPTEMVLVPRAALDGWNGDLRGLGVALTQLASDLKTKRHFSNEDSADMRWLLNVLTELESEVAATLSQDSHPGAPSKTDAKAPALAILDRWLYNMDHPEENKPLEIHHSDIAILRAAITGTPAPKEGS